ncbi:MAG: LysR family transcriptional regulator [Pseudomonadota bacterium]
MDTLDGLKTFVAVVDAGSFTAAADRLGKSKKLVSKYIGQLESKLQVRLLQRTTRTLSLTSAGQQYYPRCVELLRAFDEMTAELRDDDLGLTGTLRVSAPILYGESVVLPAASRFQSAHPELSVDLRFNDRYVDIAAEGFDVAIRIGKLEDSSLVARRLGSVELIAVASKEYLDTHGIPETPHDLKEHTCVRDANMRGGLAWPFKVDGKTVRVPVNGPFSVNSASATRNLASRAVGISLCPDHVVNDDIAAGRLTRVLHNFESARFGIYAVFLDAKRQPKRVREFLNFLSDHQRQAHDEWSVLVSR